MLSRVERYTCIQRYRIATPFSELRNCAKKMNDIRTLFSNPKKRKTIPDGETDACQTQSTSVQRQNPRDYFDRSDEIDDNIPDYAIDVEDGDHDQCDDAVNQVGRDTYGKHFKM